MVDSDDNLSHVSSTDNEDFYNNENDDECDGQDSSEEQSNDLMRFIEPPLETQIVYSPVHSRTRSRTPSEPPDLPPSPELLSNIKAHHEVAEGQYEADPISPQRSPTASPMAPTESASKARERKAVMRQIKAQIIKDKREREEREEREREEREERAEAKKQQERARKAALRAIRKQIEQEKAREAEEQKAREAENQRAREAENQRAREAEEQTAREAEEQTAREAEEEKAREAEASKKRESKKASSSNTLAETNTHTSTLTPEISVQELVQSSTHTSSQVSPSNDYRPHENRARVHGDRTSDHTTSSSREDCTAGVNSEEEVTRAEVTNDDRRDTNTLLAQHRQSKVRHQESIDSTRALLEKIEHDAKVRREKAEAREAARTKAQAAAPDTAQHTVQAEEAPTIQDGATTYKTQGVAQGVGRKKRRFTPKTTIASATPNTGQAASAAKTPNPTTTTTSTKNTTASVSASASVSSSATPKTGSAASAAKNPNPKTSTTSTKNTTTSAKSKARARPAIAPRPPKAIGMDYEVKHRTILQDTDPANLHPNGCPFCLEGTVDGKCILSFHKCRLCLKFCHAWCQNPSPSEGSGSTGACYYCQPGPMDILTHANRMKLGKFTHSAAEVAKLRALRAANNIVVLSDYKGSTISTNDDQESEGELERDDRDTGVPRYFPGANRNTLNEYGERESEDFQWARLYGECEKPADRRIHVTCKFSGNNNTKALDDREETDSRKMVMKDLFNIPKLEETLLDMSNRAIIAWRGKTSGLKNGGLNSLRVIDGSPTFTEPFSSRQDMHKRALIYIKEARTQTLKNYAPIWLKDPALNSDHEVRKRLLASFDKVTKNYSKGSSTHRTRDPYLQIWVIFNRLEAADKVKGGTRQDGALAQRCVQQLDRDGMGIDRELERFSFALHLSKQDHIRKQAAASSNPSAPLELGEMPNTELLRQSKALDNIMKKIREAKPIRDAENEKRMMSFQEYCHPMKLAKKVKLDDETMGTEMLDVMACPAQMFASIGMPFMMYRGFVPRRPDFVEQVAGTGGVAALGTTIPNADLNLLSEAQARENLNRLVWDSESRPYPWLNEAMLGIIRGEKRVPQPGEQMEPTGVTAARLAKRPTGQATADVDHTESENYGQGF